VSLEGCGIDQFKQSIQATAEPKRLIVKAHALPTTLPAAINCHCHSWLASLSLPRCSCHTQTAPATPQPQLPLSQLPLSQPQPQPLTDTAFLMRWYRSSGSAGARPTALSMRRTLEPVTLRTWATPWESLHTRAAVFNTHTAQVFFLHTAQVFFKTQHSFLHTQHRFFLHTSHMGTAWSE
jgi:hypothetical protein